MPKGMSVKEAMDEIAKQHPNAPGVKLSGDIGKEIYGEKKGKVKKRSKYFNKKILLDGYEFDSLAEANRYRELKRKVRARQIYALRVHPIYELWANDKRICKYIGDFEYKVDTRGGPQVVVEDVKNPVTAKLAAFRLKWRMMDAILNIQVRILIR